MGIECHYAILLLTKSRLLPQNEHDLKQASLLSRLTNGRSPPQLQVPTSFKGSFSSTFLGFVFSFLNWLENTAL
jgi:hypothetical protein